MKKATVTPTVDATEVITALKAAAGVLEAIRPYCLLELTTKYTVTDDGHKLGSFTIDEALDLADAALKEGK